MSFETGTASNMNDLMTKLSIFVVANGGVEDQYTAESGATDGKLSLHIDTVYVHYAWNSSQSPNIGVYHSLGFISAGTDLWANTDDSGNGTASTPDTGSVWNSLSIFNRFIGDIGNGPYTSYHFFHDDATVEYFHIALEYGPNTFRHFGFGQLEKYWDFTGKGEYCYGHTQADGNPETQDALISSNGTSSTSLPERHATIHVEGLPGQPGSSKWGSTARFTSLGSVWLDRAGNQQVRIVGGCPSGPIGSQFSILPSNAGDGFLPLVPNTIFYRDVTAAPDNVYFMGFQPDVRTVNMKSLVAKEEITVGDDTYMVFPHVRKQNTGVLEESRNLGIAYKKIV